MNNVLVKENERKIEKFDLDFALKHKEYRKASAIAALGVANSITDAYFSMEEAKSDNEAVLRLYALLQGLFVSIDAMYALSEAITGSNDGININSNPYMRTLRYIRNDVVGHPANRTLNQKYDAYCILNPKSIKTSSFEYSIYSNETIINKTVNIDELLNQYYIEANKFLDYSYSINSKFNDVNSLKPLITKTMDDYYRTGRYQKSLNEFIDRYKNIYPDGNRYQNRNVWRYEMVLRLKDVSNSDPDILDVVNYTIGIIISKMYKTLVGFEYKHKKDFNLPAMVLSMYRFFNRNPEYIAYIRNLKDPENPLFYESLRILYEAVSLKKMDLAMDYLGFMITLYKGMEHDLVYAIALPIREYRNKNMEN